MKSYILESEIPALMAKYGPAETIAYQDVTASMLSLARHAGGATIHGK